MIASAGRTPSMAWTVLLVILLPSLEIGCAQAAGALRPDVDRLLRAAGSLDGTWPAQPPPAIAEVAAVARHGKVVVPLLMAALSDDPHLERDRRRWKAQQQITLALSRIYAESRHCGRIYCDGDPPERIARVRDGWRRVIAFDEEMRTLPVDDLLARFKAEKVFWRQLEIGKVLAAVHDRAAVTELEAWLTHDDRHVRANVALVLGRLGDPRGFDTIAAILGDRSVRLPGQGGDRGGRWSLPVQIREDRYYAAHLLGDLKDPRGTALLIPLLNDEDVGRIVPWSLAEIGARRAITPLIEQLEQDEPYTRVLAIHALETLNAREALPKLRQLLQDTRRANFGNLTVAETARHALAVLGQSS
jgi:HEAT repeat protein